MASCSRWNGRATANAWTASAAKLLDEEPVVVRRRRAAVLRAAHTRNEDRDQRRDALADEVEVLVLARRGGGRLGRHRERRLEDGRAMVAAAEASGCVNMVGFNYIRTPASRLARDIIASGEIGDVTYFRGEHTEDFLADPDKFALGVCNGCQMMALLKDIIPGAENWPRFVNNTSEQFEARSTLVAIPQNPSIFMSAMAGTMMPIAVAHGEGRAEFVTHKNQQDVLPALHYVDNYGMKTEQYPANPNGSPEGIAGVTTEDGRFTIMMPHPERVFRTTANSWHPADWGEDSGWMRLFRNARAWLD